MCVGHIEACKGYNDATHLLLSLTTKEVDCIGEARQNNKLFIMALFESQVQKL